MTLRPKNPGQMPTEIPLLPLSGAILLPGTQHPFIIFEPRYISLVDDALRGNRLVGLIQPADNSTESPQGKNVPLKPVGCLGYIRAFEEQEDDRYLIVLEGIARFRPIEEIPGETPYRKSKFELGEFAHDMNPDVKSDTVDREELLQSIREFAQFADIDFDWEGIAEIETPLLVDMCCVAAPYDASEKQALLETTTVFERAQTLIAISQLKMVNAGFEVNGSTLN